MIVLGCRVVSLPAVDLAQLIEVNHGFRMLRAQQLQVEG